MSVNNRKLKVQNVGDYYKREIIPKIRLQGKWLLDAGIKPNNHVYISNPEPGVLVIRDKKES